MESRSRLSRLADRRKALWLVDRDGSNPREILKDVSYFDWYDNRHILFASQAENGRAQIQIVELTSRAVTLLVQTSAIELDVSKDGSNLLYTGRRQPFRDESVGAAFAGRPQRDANAQRQCQADHGWRRRLACPQGNVVPGRQDHRLHARLRSREHLHNRKLPMNQLRFAITMPKP